MQLFLGLFQNKFSSSQWRFIQSCNNKYMNNINQLNGQRQIKCKHNVNNAEIQAFEYRWQLISQH